jgi:hypothetical protein
VGYAGYVTLVDRVLDFASPTSLVLNLGSQLTILSANSTALSRQRFRFYKGHDYPNHATRQKYDATGVDFDRGRDQPNGHWQGWNTTMDRTQEGDGIFCESDEESQSWSKSSFCQLEAGC